MADDDRGSKTEEPTEHKLEKLREEGQVPFSREFVMALQIMAVFAIFYITSDTFQFGLMEDIKKLINQAFTITEIVQKGNLSQILLSFAWVLVKYTLPLALIVLIIGVISGLIQNGFLIQTKTLEPNLNKLNPVTGFQKYLKMRNLIESGKAFIKFVIMGAILYVVVVNNIKDITYLPSIDFMAGFTLSKKIVFSGAASLCLFVIALGLFDLWYQRFQFRSENKMSKQDIKEELKERDGDPLVRARMRSLARQLANRKMITEIPKATAIIVNPTHYAIAILYEEGFPAPKVIAKGVDYLAHKIKMKAQEHEIPIIQNRALARSLYKKTKVGAFVPNEFFQAIAEVIAHVYKLRNKFRRSP